MIEIDEQSKNNAKGFIFLEILASLVILSLMAVYMLSAYLPAAKWLNVTRQKMAATYYALAVMEFYREEGISSSLADGEEKEIPIFNEYIDDSFNLSGQIAFCPAGIAGLYHARVVVFWDENDRSRSLQLHSFLSEAGGADG